MSVRCNTSRKIRFAHIPKDGDPGLTLLVTPTTLTFNTASSANRIVKVEVYRGGKKLKYGDEFLCSVLSTKSTVTKGLTWSCSTYSGEFLYTLSYVAGNDISLSIPFTVTVDGVAYPASIGVQTVRDGTNGTGSDGRNGVWVPPMMLWSDYPDDYVFQAGDPASGDVRLDMVLVKAANGNLIPYYCLETHVKGDSPYSPETDTEYWTPADAGVYRCLATDLLAAQNARIDFLSGQAIRVGNAAEMCGYFGAPTATGAVFYTGANNVAQATFVVYKDGRVTASNMHISGNSTFRGFVFHEKTCITAANYASMSTTVSYELGQSRTELNLMKTGNWIEIMSLPGASGNDYTSLPAIRTGMAYTDAYRDYVRQFLGNELYIYNSSDRSVAVDTGESSVEIRKGMACAFRMVLSPETERGIALERIKWEYTGPFQY